jgi:hypothetical protein
MLVEMTMSGAATFLRELMSKSLLVVVLVSAWW